MATTTLVIFVCILTVVSGELGLPCMQKDKLQATVSHCFSKLGRKDMINLDPTDQGGTLGQASRIVSRSSCSHEDDVVDGLDCFYDFIGNCLNMKKMLPSHFNIKDAFSYACTHVGVMQDPCIGSLVKGMMTCYLEKVKERQLAILLRKARVGTIEQETCRYLGEEMTCLAKASSTCSRSTRDVFSTYMRKLIPNTCRHPGLLETLKNSSKLRGLALTRMDRDPR